MNFTPTEVAYIAYWTKGAFTSQAAYAFAQVAGITVAEIIL